MLDQNILLVDDHDLFANLIIDELKNFNFTRSSSVQSAIDLLESNHKEISVVLIDLEFPLDKLQGIDLVNMMNEKYPDIPYIIMSGCTDIKKIVSGMESKRVKFIIKGQPKMFDELELAIFKAIHIKEKIESDKQHQFLTYSIKMKSKIAKLDIILKNTKAADLKVLITGESGTGKECMARYIAKRLNRPFIAVNMGGMNSNLSASELFGHVKGAFTGAVKGKIGIFEKFSDGVIFLDEIADCPMDIQIQLFRAIQEKEITKVGCNKTIKINPIIISATNLDLEELIKENKFREELYHRLATFKINLLSLRERPKDIELFTFHFLNEFSNQNPIDITPDALEYFRNYPWKGNIRELRNVILKLSALAKESNSEISLKLVKEALEVKISPKINKELIIKTLNKFEGNKTQTSNALNIHRNQLYRYLKQYQIDEIIESKKGRPVKRILA